MLKKNPLPILLGILALLLIGRFAGPALLPILRGVIIAAAVYFLYSKIRSVFVGPKNQSTINRKDQNFESAKIIDLCPECGRAVSDHKKHDCLATK